MNKTEKDLADRTEAAMGHYTASREVEHYLCGYCQNSYTLDELFLEKSGMYTCHDCLDRQER